MSRVGPMNTRISSPSPTGPSLPEGAHIGSHRLWSRSGCAGCPTHHTLRTVVKGHLQGQRALLAPSRPLNKDMHPWA